MKKISNKKIFVCATEQSGDNIGEKILRSEGDKRSEKRLKKYLNSEVDGSVYIFELNNKVKAKVKQNGEVIEHQFLYL